MAVDRDEIMQKLAAFGRHQISQAGARYTPGHDPDAPNITNETLLADLNYLACSMEAVSAFATAAEALEKNWSSSARNAFQDPAAADAAIADCASLLRDVPHRILDGDLTVRDSAVSCLRAVSSLISAEEKRVESLEREIREKHGAGAHNDARQAIADSTRTSSIESKLYDLRRLGQEVDDIGTRLDGAPGALLVKRLCLMVGEWGTGKTHFLCDFAKHRLDQGRPVLFMLAKSFQAGRGIANAIAETTGIAAKADQLVEYLNELGAALGERVLIIVDGINEGPRSAWRNAVEDLLNMLSSRRYVALVVSCRTPFESYVLPDVVRSQMETIVHHGFDEQEFDAQAEFFRYYKVPLPEVPLLEDEFSRPLTLKLICEAFRGLSTRKQRDGFHGLASGQKGMTFVLESFVNLIAEPIERRHGLPRKACWELLKGHRRIANPTVAGFAGHMAATLREYVTRRAAHQIVRAQFSSLSYSQRTRLLEDMRIAGLLDEDYVWVSARGAVRKQLVLRLPYQRFSDHLIARHLLERYLIKSDEASLRASFSPRSPLGRVFGKKRHRYGYARPGWAEALIVEFPEAVKRVAQTDRELFFFLPRRAQNLNYYYSPFVHGMFWRAPTSFSLGTARIVSTLLQRAKEQTWRQTVDALVAISIKPRHPYSAKRLYNYLAGYSMAERDRTWSEYLRQNYASPSILRLLTWVERQGPIRLPAAIAEQLIVLLSLVLTTVVRRDRDVATRALVELGERHPQALFAHTLKSLEFNDPYVGERMLAASYGVAMSKYACLPGTRFRRVLGDYGLALYEKMFEPDARFATHHALRRDYAVSTIRLAMLAQPDYRWPIDATCLEELFSDVPSPFPPPAEVSEQQIAEVDGTIHMDFGNYTIGRLIPGRANYDDSHPVYKEVRRQIEWRIWNLGYRKADFEQIDRQVGRFGSRNERSGARIDRYGKKYAWIAFFEMYGLREAKGQLDNWRERTSDCDIDPSFPRAPVSNWTAPLPPQCGDRSTSTTEWVGSGATPDFRPLLKIDAIDRRKGPWILLEGFVQQQDKSLDREIFTLLRGLLVKRKDIARIREAYLNIQYPGNSKIPDIPQDYYLYAGEAGTSPRFASDLRRKDGSIRRFTVDAFSTLERVPVPAESPQRQVTIRLPRHILDAAGIEAGPAKEDDEDEFSLLAPATERWRRIPGIKVELPARRFSWESYHSDMNSFSGFMMPAASIIDTLGLRTWNREVEFRDNAGKLATMYREAGDLWTHGYHLLYIREDCLRAYLRLTRQTLAWCNWGERGWADKELYSEREPERMAIFESHRHIHRQFHEFGRL